MCNFLIYIKLLQFFGCNTERGVFSFHKADDALRRLLRQIQDFHFSAFCRFLRRLFRKEPDPKAGTNEGEDLVCGGGFDIRHKG